MIGTGRAAIEEAGQLLFPPGPEVAGVLLSLWDGKFKGDQRRAIRSQDRFPILPSFGIVPLGIVEGVEHPPSFIEIADKAVVRPLGFKVSRFRFRHLGLVQEGPVTGGSGQVPKGFAAEGVIFPAAHVRDRMEINYGLLRMVLI